MRDEIISQALSIRQEAESMVIRGTYDRLVWERAVRLHRMLTENRFDDAMLSDHLDRLIQITAGCLSVGFLKPEHARILHAARAIRDDLFLLPKASNG